MCPVIWDKRGILLIEFLPRDKTNNNTIYCEALKKLRCAMQNKRRGMLTEIVVWIQNNSQGLGGIYSFHHIAYFSLSSTLWNFP